MRYEDYKIRKDQDSQPIEVKRHIKIANNVLAVHELADEGYRLLKVTTTGNFNALTCIMVKHTPLITNKKQQIEITSDVEYANQLFDSGYRLSDAIGTGNHNKLTMIFVKDV